MTFLCNFSTIRQKKGTGLRSRVVYLLNKISTNQRKNIMNKRKSLVILIILAVSHSGYAIAANAEKPIPRSVAGDKGKYYLLESTRNGNIVSAISKRVGVDSIGYTKTETNCATMTMREIGYSEESPNKIKASPTKWFDLVPGSSKSDLAHYVCNE